MSTYGICVESGNRTAFSPSTSVFPSWICHTHSSFFTTGTIELQQMIAIANKALLCHEFCWCINLTRKKRTWDFYPSLPF
jgi:hypothetical protein